MAAESVRRTAIDGYSPCLSVFRNIEATSAGTLTGSRLFIEKVLMEENNLKVIPADNAGFIYLCSGNRIPTATEFRSQFGDLQLTPAIERSDLQLALANVEPDTAARPDELNSLHFSSAVNQALDGKINDLETVGALLLASRKKLISTRFRIIYQDDYCVVIHKPCGLLVHRSEKADDRECVLQLLRDQLNTFVHPSHRLDRQTSGVLLFTLTKEANGVFSQEFEHRRVTKEYLALVRGWTDDEGVIDRPLKQGRQNIEREAITEYKTIGRAELPYPVRPYDTARYSLVRINLLTGRTHQIRRHFCSISHPLVGDVSYGDGYHNRLFREKFNFHRIFLLSERLAMKHPFTGEELDFRTKPDASLMNVIEKLGLTSALEGN